MGRAALPPPCSASSCTVMAATARPVAVAKREPSSAAFHAASAAVRTSASPHPVYDSGQHKVVALATTFHRVSTLLRCVAGGTINGGNSN